MRHLSLRKHVFALVLITVLICLAMAYSGVSAGMAYPPGRQGDAQVGAGGLYIRSHRVTVTIDNQVATTKIEQVFVNEGARPAEGTYLFPLPIGAAVSDLTLYIDGVPVKGQILDAKQAQAIYTEIVRKLRDPVLLQYVGRTAIQANIFPIPAGQERKIEITYSNIAPADGGLINYTYPLRTDYASALPVREMSLSVDVTSKDPISTIYSPNPMVIVSRTGDNSFRAGFEATNFRAADDFSIYYGVASKAISASLLTYRASATEDGFFMLMLTPPTKVDASAVIPKDVLIVLDQSGSMGGEKWDQARSAAAYVLKNLNPQDRFNAVVFSTGYRIYARALQPVSEADNAISWINGLEALGGTDIDGALSAAMDFVDPTRQTVVLFLTDGLPTEGVTDSRTILTDVKKRATPNLRIFTFGVGNDVDTFLLDSLSSSYGGTSVYVRPQEDIEQKVSSLYNKITSPVLTAIKVDVDGPMLDDMYPAAPLPDLFAGSQLIITGRFRDGGKATITLTGQLNGARQTYTFSDLSFPANAGGQPFISRLWATRKIGTLLNQIRLNGETPELVQSVVQLSVRYGIITPYTSYLIQEEDINARRDGAGGGPGAPPSTPAPVMALQPTAMVNQPVVPGAPASGEGAVDRAKSANELEGSDTAAAAPTALPTATAAGAGGYASGRPEEPQKGTGAPGEVLKTVNDRTFIFQKDVWVDTLYTEGMKVQDVTFLSDDYFKLLTDHPEIKDYLAIGERVLVVIDNVAYNIKPE